MTMIKYVAERIEAVDGFRHEFEQIVPRVRGNFEWYDKMVTESGYEEDLQPGRLPLIDEAVLSLYYYEAHIPQPAQNHVYLTSGTSTGARKRILYSREDHIQYVHQRKRIFSNFVTSDCRTACSDLGTGHAASSASEIFAEMGIKHHVIDFRRPINEHVELLNDYRPAVLFTMPVVLDRIIQTGDIRFRPKKIIIVGDIATRAWKNYITRCFGLNKNDLLDIYGSIEVGCIAYECFDCGAYHFDDHIIPETIKPRDFYEGFDYGRDSEVLVLTSTARTMFPAIRYVTNDLVEGFRTLVCKGKAVFSYDRIVGRIGSELKIGEKISLYDIGEAVNTILPGSRFEVHKNGNAFVIRVSCLDFNEDKAEQIRSYVRMLNPAIDQMIKSGLVEDITVCGVAAEELSPALLKSSFLIRKNVKPCVE